MIAVRGMEMPKNCLHCRFKYDQLCHAVGQSFREHHMEENGRLKDCPLVEVVQKEQEPVKPEFDSLDGNVGRWRCGNCHISIGAVRAPYCWHCGKPVKWDD